ncbi:MAG: hypothetical protein K9H48_15075 [Melioribacteraceae bacterium]|nr:hypothetical protein [Saprospiraceae bacterium]MCF8355773.1 hypothetical protein [Melioribacteraceae bacterium]MCF8394801.1 hypothetical protein [Melioribacteraceae bacterium]
MQKTVKKINRKEETENNLKYWNSKTLDEKLDAVQQLREQYITLFNKQAEYNESRKRLRRFYKIIKQS